MLSLFYKEIGFKKERGGFILSCCHSGCAFSNYYHGQKYHYSSLVSKWDSHSDKGSAPAGETSEAWIWTKFGEPVAFYYDYD